MSERVQVDRRLFEQLAAQGDVWFLETICLREMQQMTVGEVHQDTMRAGELEIAVTFERTADGLRVTEAPQEAA